MGYKIVSDGTDTHLLVLNLKPKVELKNKQYIIILNFIINIYINI